MKNNLKSRIYSSVTIGIIIGVLVCVYLIGGVCGIYAWNLALFILGPLGVVLSVICVVALFVKLLKRKKILEALINSIISLCLAFPVLILFGFVTISFPAKENDLESITIQVPVEGSTILFGGKDYETHVIWPSERFAYDILAEPFDIESTNLEDYGVFGKRVFSPIKGEIIEVHDGEEDIVPNTEEFSSSLGNYVFMKIDETKTYLIFAHLKEGSIEVKEGEVVEIGRILGEVGNSGTTSEPHLHFQHQKNDPRNMNIPTLSEGLPIIFSKELE